MASQNYQVFGEYSVRMYRGGDDALSHSPPLDAGACVLLCSCSGQCALWYH